MSRSDSPKDSFGGVSEPTSALPLLNFFVWKMVSGKIDFIHINTPNSEQKQQYTSSFHKLLIMEEYDDCHIIEVSHIFARPRISKIGLI